ncbi:MAG: type II secretion system GspH family protein [Alphaproteobacteria bacterium]|nr:type II secretion system GspH family protein [Alphaproteobacteria bacterium]
MIRNSNERGRSMIEMLGVLAIVGVLTVGGIAGYGQAMAKFKVNKTTEQIAGLIQGIRENFTQGNYYGLGETKAVFEGTTIIPQEMCKEVDSCSELQSPFGTDVTITTATPYRTFTITYKNLTKQVCSRLIMTDWGSGSSSGLLTVNGGGTAASEMLCNAQQGTCPPTFSDVATKGCTEKTATNSVSWTFN